MAVSNNIDELYSLITNSDNKHQTFIENLELWQKFYNDRYIIIKNNILNPKLFTIIKFLLEQEHGEVFEYFHSELIKEVAHSQGFITFNIKNSNAENSSEIDELFNNLNYHDDLCNFLATQQISDPFGDIKKYSSQSLQLETADSLISVIYKLFLFLEPEIVKKSLNFITKTIITTENKRDITAKEAIYQYLNKIIPIKNFIGENISEDELVKQITAYQIQDINILTRFFDDLSIEVILKIFKNDLSKIIDFLNNVNYINNISKQTLVTNLLNRILKTEDYNPELLSLIMKEEKPEFLTEDLFRYLYNKIIISSLNNPIFDFDSNMIKYLLTAEYKPAAVEDKKELDNYSTARQNFIAECRSLINNKQYLQSNENFDIEGINKLLQTIELPINSEEDLTITKTDTLINKEQKASKRSSLGLDIDSATAIELFNAYFEDEVELNQFSAQAIIRSIANEMLNQLEIESNGVYYYTANQTNGFFNPTKSFIALNNKLIDKFLDDETPLYQRLQIMITMFHEITHAICDQARKNNIWNIEVYEMEKEWLTGEYDKDFYEENYEYFKEEIEARINGINCFTKFIETFSPHLLDEIQNKIIEELEDEKNFKADQANNIMFFLKDIVEEFNIGFDTLIRYNPSILEKQPIFNLEYYPNGQPKTYEDIWLYRTEETEDLINEILKRRYPLDGEQLLKSTHNK